MDVHDVDDVDRVDVLDVCCPPLTHAPEWLLAYEEAFPLESWTDADVLAQAVSTPAGEDLLGALAGVDVSVLSADEAVTFAEQVDRVVAHVVGVQARARAQVRDRLVRDRMIQTTPTVAGSPGSGFVTAEMLASAELAAALRVAPRSMDAQLDHVTELTGPMLPLLDALLAGDLSAGHVSAIARELRRLPAYADPRLAEEYAQQCARILGIVLPYAATHTAGQAGRKARSLVAVIDPVGSAARRQDAAEREHDVHFEATGDGSCEITAVMPLAHGAAVMSAIRTLAKDSRFTTADGCLTAGQRRVAAFTTLILGDPGAVATITGPVSEAKVTAHINVIIPLTALITGCTSTGPTGTYPTSAPGGRVAGEVITHDILQDLLTDASESSTLRRLVTDPTGCIIDAGRTRYAISDTQRHLLTLRDQTCRFPGCTRPAEQCEIDHATPWRDDGRTDLANLGPLCKHHHQLKTHGGWQITTSHRNGFCSWRSPLGRIYQHDPPDLLPPEPPAEPAPTPVDAVSFGPPPF